MGRLGRTASIALTVLSLLAGAACGSQPGDVEPPAVDDSPVPDRPATMDRPVVEVPSGQAPAFLDPDAEPTTDLGRLRAQHLPVWTSDFDWAFPPEVCNTAWELDGIAQPTIDADVSVMGDFATAAALTVMRYEHQLSRALADPSVLAQLCVATASVEPARSDALGVLESYLATGARRSQPAAYPEEVWIVGLSPISAISVACVTPGYPAIVAEDGAVVEAPRAPVRLQAYLLTVSRGLEDQVTDISYRVSSATHRPADDCQGLSGWALEWDGHVQTWISEGQIWEPLGFALTSDEICDSPPADGPEECPRDWPQ